MTFHLTAADWITVIGLLVTIELGVVNGTIKLTNAIPDAWVPRVQAWCGILAAIGGGIITALSRMVGAVLVGIILSLVLWGNPAMAQVKLLKPTGNIVNDIAAATGQRAPNLTGAPVTDLQNFLNAKFLPDLQYSLRLAQASKNSITADCYQAWIDIITTQQTAVLDTSTPPQPLPMPDPHVITEFEKLVELRNALQPESPFMVKCSPVASMVKKDIAGFMALVISGGAGLATLVPGL